MNNDLISREALKKAVGEQKKPKAYSVADERQNILVDCILYIIDNAPTVPLPDFKEGYKQAIIDGKTNFSRPQGEWKVIGFSKTRWHVFCPKCNCDMFTEFTSYCPNCGEPKKEINIAELDMRGDEE